MFRRDWCMALLVLSAAGVAMLDGGATQFATTAAAAPLVSVEPVREPVVDLVQLYGRCHNCTSNCFRSYYRCQTFASSEARHRGCRLQMSQCQRYCRHRCPGR